MTHHRFGRLNLVDLAGSERYNTFSIMFLEHFSIPVLLQEVNEGRIICEVMITSGCVNRQKSSGAEGERLKEASNINKSLSTLGY